MNNRLIDSADTLKRLYVQRAELQIKLRHQKEDLDAVIMAAKPSAEVYSALGSNEKARELAVEKMLADNETVTAIKKQIAVFQDAVATLDAEINGEEKFFSALSISVTNETNSIYGRRDILGELLAADTAAELQPDDELENLSSVEIPDEMGQKVTVSVDELLAALGYDPDDDPNAAPEKKAEKTGPDEEIPF